MSIPSRQKQGSWEVEAGGSDHRVPGQPGLHLKEKGRGRKRWGGRKKRKSMERRGRRKRRKREKQKEEEKAEKGEEEEEEQEGGRGGGAGRGGKRRIRKRRGSSKRKGSRKRRGGKRRRRTSVGQHWLWCGQGIARENRVGKQGQAPKGV